MIIKDKAAAQNLANRSLVEFKQQVTSLVVSDSGDVFINGDLPSIKKEHPKQKMFVLIPKEKE